MLLLLFFTRILHFHQHLVKDINVAGKSQRTLAAVPILGFCFFQENLEQRVISVLGLDNEPLHLWSNIDGETTFGCHTTAVVAAAAALLCSLAAGPGFAPHHHHAAFASSYPLASLQRFGDEPFSHLLFHHLFHITHLRIDSDRILNI
ncbi:hypothetical protein V8G54_018940 [Vigna mungo]|uniref:Uncharacterized protein n=1 Tax=Vigna mungo TaxID=3915 RepID=A0AAQ3N973_VIGMU